MFCYICGLGVIVCFKAVVKRGLKSVEKRGVEKGDICGFKGQGKARKGKKDGQRLGVERLTSLAA